MPVIPLIISVLIVIAGVFIGLFVEAADLRLFGWILVVVGVLGIASMLMLRQRGFRYSRRRPR